MAREIAEIETELDQNIEQVFDDPSASNGADWKLWRSIWAMAIWTFEKIMDIHQGNVESIISSKRYGTLAWYHDRVMEFQGADDGEGFQGDRLIIDDNGKIVYEVSDESRRIIAQASLKESSSGIAIKVAKWEDDILVQLVFEEQEALIQYLFNIKYPGTRINVISLPADIFKYDINIYYDPKFSKEDVKQRIMEAIESFKTLIGFDARFYKQKFIDHLMAIDGVVTIKLNSLMVKTATSDYTEIDVVHELESGYLNYQPTEGEIPSRITMINSAEL
ncbi:hypothetical protein [Persicobacter sp. CCB-QB2]|uniref:hypothetical protein n=1 Tax=Persicobacter sp. CCB-QB2 TaxID=1561025 RepID=UPI0006A9BC79|nr:hypothetical protein [Persicobacter sp. CCB-QB2]